MYRNDISVCLWAWIQTYWRSFLPYVDESSIWRSFYIQTSVTSVGTVTRMKSKQNRNRYIPDVFIQPPCCKIYSFCDLRCRLSVDIQRCQQRNYAEVKDHTCVIHTVTNLWVKQWKRLMCQSHLDGSLLTLNATVKLNNCDICRYWRHKMMR